MQLKCLMTLATLAKIGFVLSVGCIHTSEATKYEPIAYPKEKDLHSHSRGDALQVYMQIYHVLTMEQRHEFVQSIDSMTKKHTVDNKDQQEEDDMHEMICTYMKKNSHVYGEQDACLEHSQQTARAGALFADTPEAESDTPKPKLPTEPISAKDAMELAIKAAEKAVKYMQDLTNDIIKSAHDAMKEIDQWGSKIEGLKREELEKYEKQVAEAIVTLVSSETQAQNLYKSMETLVGLTIHDMKTHMNDENMLKQAIKNAQITMSVQMEETVKTLQKIEQDVKKTQTTFTVAARTSASFSKTVQDHLDNKDGYVDAQANSLRAKAYGGCAACVVLPPTCPVCYATAAGVVETQIKQMKEHLKSTKKSLNSLKGQFDNLSTDCDKYAERAESDYKVMDDISQQLDITKNTVVASDDLGYWTNIILPLLEKLENSLAEALKGVTPKTTNYMMIGAVKPCGGNQIGYYNHKHNCKRAGGACCSQEEGGHGFNISQDISGYCGFCYTGRRRKM